MFRLCRFVAELFEGGAIAVCVGLYDLGIFSFDQELFIARFEFVSVGLRPLGLLVVFEILLSFGSHGICFGSHQIWFSHVNP